MAKLVWRNLVGQERVKETLSAAFDSGTLGHAYLFSGAEGVGKFQAALELAMGLLCTCETEVPCGECESCRLVLRHAHPDFNLVFPVVLAKEHRSSGSSLSQTGWKCLSELLVGKIDNPYRLEAHSGLPQIPVEWIREFNHAVLRGASRGQWNIGIICGIDGMNTESANAMLKTLEEPPPNTILLLCTDRPHAVLPTVLSRCQVLRFGYLSPGLMEKALVRMRGLAETDEGIANAVRCAGGSLGRALQLLDQPIDEQLAQARALLSLCSEPDWLRVADGIEALSGKNFNMGRDYGACERVLTYVIYVLREGVLAGVGGGGNYFLSDSAGATGLAVPSDPNTVGNMIEICQDAIDGARARGNIMMVLTALVTAMRELIHGKEQ